MSSATKLRTRARGAGLCLALLFLLAATALDEGFWAWESLPLERLRRDHGFEPDRAWFDKLQSATLHYEQRGTAAFVSRRGLVLTSWNLARRRIEALVGPDLDPLKHGYLALRPDDELRLPGLRLRQLDSVARAKGLRMPTGKEASGDAGRRALDAFRRAEEESTGLECRLRRRRGEFWVYRYRVFDDVRLVFAPERSAAGFGGAQDTRTWPRAVLDAVLLRVWEDGEPLESETFLPVSGAPPKVDDLLLSAGFPAFSGRDESAPLCRFNRDHFYPAILAHSDAVLKGLDRYLLESESTPAVEEERDRWLMVRKDYAAQLEALRRPETMAAVEERDRRFVKLAGEDGPKVAASLERLNEILTRYAETSRLRIVLRLEGRLVEVAEGVLQFLEASKKPAETADGGGGKELLDGLRTQLLSTPKSDAKKEAMINGSLLRAAARMFGEDQPVLKAALDGRTPEELEEELSRTRLGDRGFVEEILDRGAAAWGSRPDPLIELLRRMKPGLDALDDERRRTFWGPFIRIRRDLRQRMDDSGVLPYPVPDNTLRLVYGRMRGYTEGARVHPPRATFHAVYDRDKSFESTPPWRLPPTWRRAVTRLNAGRGLSLVCDLDFVTGLEGAPLVDRKGRLVGMLTGRNRWSLFNLFTYVEPRARGVALDVQGLLEALRKIYEATALADEIEGRRSFK